MRFVAEIILRTIPFEAEDAEQAREHYMRQTVEATLRDGRVNEIDVAVFEQTEMDARELPALS